MINRLTGADTADYADSEDTPCDTNQQNGGDGRTGPRLIVKLRPFFLVVLGLHGLGDISSQGECRPTP